MTTLIGIMPSMQQSTVTIPATVKAITGYQAAVVYDTQSGKIVNPTFNPTTGITLTGTQALLDLGSVGAFQHVGTITDGSSGSTVTPPSMSDATGLPTLTTINFANNSQLQSIGPKAFLGCNNLTTVNLPNTANTIGTQAFQNCTNLQTINLKGVSYIGDAAFNNAFIAQNDALAQANPVSLDLTSAQYIGVGAFDSSVWTSTPTGGGSPEQVLPGTAADGSHTITEAQNLSKISSVSFSKPLTTLSAYAFNGANYLTAADLSNCTSLAAVGNNAFSGTQNLASVKFSNTIDTIGNNAFSGATSLKSAN